MKQILMLHNGIAGYKFNDCMRNPNLLATTRLSQARFSSTMPNQSQSTTLPSRILESKNIGLYLYSLRNYVSS